MIEIIQTASKYLSMVLNGIGITTVFDWFDSDDQNSRALLNTSFILTLGLGAIVYKVFFEKKGYKHRW